MTTYVALTNWTDQGMRAIEDAPRRLDAAKALLEEMGGRFKDCHMTMGEYDLLLVYEAPDDAVAARFTLALGRLGNLRTKTLKAFPENAFREIIRSLH
ncbi:GYD domain-containing protein [Plastoroseomonas hellenica]|uniref:GYD domain-containing protein n=1 Tax=Plastoroseomonas hellenica TaxID=2687306 RepID=A0ABS5F594_9PROT|nr:GYD domain-containing protein [Plastoroseomonas hellenica]MBR0644954.1 GYD domain-containing protein [Plastoroseomonas hellenica]MBR0667743.1 GYD domain-containing protein [Plastoroseomonas hellenica]